MSIEVNPDIDSYFLECMAYYQMLMLVYDITELSEPESKYNGLGGYMKAHLKVNIGPFTAGEHVHISVVMDKVCISANEKQHEFYIQLQPPVIIDKIKL